METVLIAVKSALITAFAFVTTLAQILAPVTAQLFKGKDSFFEDWSAAENSQEVIVRNSQKILMKISEFLTLPTHS